MRKGLLNCSCNTKRLLTPTNTTVLTKVFPVRLNSEAPVDNGYSKTGLRGSDIWTDRTNIYYSDFDDYRSGGYDISNGQHYVLTNGEWHPATPMNWSDLDYFSPYGLWTDGTNIYHSKGAFEDYNDKHYVLQGNRWVSKTWEGLTEFGANRIWSDGVNIYCSAPSDSDLDTTYVLKGNKWEVKTWDSNVRIYGQLVWSDGTSIYHGFSHILVGNSWEEKTWEDFENGRNGDVYQCLWTDGTNIYYCSPYDQFYVLKENKWESIEWEGLSLANDPYFVGRGVWTDGNNYYYSMDDLQYVFLPTTAKMYSKTNGEWVKTGSLGGISK